VSDRKEPTLRVGAVDGEPAVTLAAGELEATFLPGLGLLGTSLRHRGEELLALPAPPGSRSTWTAWSCPPTRPGCRSTAP
jgi:hypothetical protein